MTLVQPSVEPGIDLSNDCGGPYTATTGGCIVSAREGQPTVTDSLLSCFLHCKTKFYLSMQASDCSQSDVAEFYSELERTYRAEAIAARFPDATLFNALLSRERLSRVKHCEVLLAGKIDATDLAGTVDVFRESGKSGPLYRCVMPVLFVPQNRFGEVERLRLCFAARLLEKVLGRFPPVGRIVYGPRFKISGVRFSSKVQARLESALQEVRSIFLHCKEPKLRLNKHCRVCRFEAKCRSRAIEKDDLSLLPALRENVICDLNRRGIFTITQYAFTFRPKRTLQQTGYSKFLGSLKAAAIRDGRIYLVEQPEIHLSPIEVFMDIESIPHQEFYYLVGCLIVEGEKRRHLSFWAANREEEGKMWRQFLTLMATYPVAKVFHYGRAESEFIEAMSRRFEGDSKVVTHLRRNAVNVLSLFSTKVYFPTYGNGLKEIARFLRFEWCDPEATGLMSVIWRNAWEKTNDSRLKEKLISYNRDDCAALERVTSFLREISREDQGRHPDGILSAEEIENPSRRKFGQTSFALEDLEFISKYAYFNYQRDKILLRAKSWSRRRRSRQSRKLRYRINKSVIFRPQVCRACGSRALYKHGRYAKTVLDMAFSNHGVRRSVVRYIGIRVRCIRCKRVSQARRYVDVVGKYGHGFLCWFVYQHIGLRQTMGQVQDQLVSVFGYWVRPQSLGKLKTRAAQIYSTTFKKIVRRVTKGHVVYVDETSVSVGGKRGYVWAFTNRQDVFYVFSKTREGSTPRHYLHRFSGVLVSDFFSAYDSIKCRQQKCLIHLVRDLNDDLRKNQTDEEFCSLTKSFAVLLRRIVETIDRYGLQRRRMKKHKPEVERFFRSLALGEFASEPLNKYKKRLLKNKEELFEFLDHDDVAWNNNNAEHAIKAFVNYRRVTDGAFSEAGIQSYLSLLSIQQSCKLRSVDFLRFLLSRKKDVEAFATAEAKAGEASAR